MIRNQNGLVSDIFKKMHMLLIQLAISSQSQCINKKFKPTFYIPAQTRKFVALLLIEISLHINKCVLDRYLKHDLSENSVILKLQLITFLSDCYQIIFIKIISRMDYNLLSISLTLYF